MRNRFKPNIPPRGSRNAASSRSTFGETSGSRTPHRNSNGTEETINKALSSTENPTENVDTTNNTRDKDAEPQSDQDANNISKESTDEINTKGLKSNDSSASKDSTANASPGGGGVRVRRSRIKPAVKPVSRPRGSSTKGKQAPNNDTQTEAGSSVEVQESQTTASVTDTPFVPPRVKAVTPPAAMQDSTNIMYVDQAFESSDKTVKTTASPTSLDTTETTTTACTPNTVTTTTSTTTLTSRRKRTLPNLAGASRRRRAPSVSRDYNSEKGVPQAETRTAIGGSEQQNEDPAILATNETSTTSGPTEPSKRPRLASGSDSIVPMESSSSLPELVVSEKVVTETTVEEEAEEQEQPPKKVEEKKRKHSKIHRPKEPLDPSKMTLQDLIYFNPRVNPMKSSVDAKKKRGEKINNKTTSDSQSEVNSATEPAATDTVPPDPPEIKGTEDHEMEDEGGGEEASLAPQVKIAEDGTIILDEESLVIRSSPDNTMEESEIVYEDNNAVNYAAYLKQRKVGRWGLKETLKFYKALSQVGADFSLMLPLFPTRQRKELKAKFKREEKVNRSLVDKALERRLPIDLEEFTAAAAAAANAIKNKTENTTQHKIENKTEDTTEKRTKNTTENTTENITENITEDTTEDTTEKRTEDTAENTTEDITENTTENTTENINENTTEDTTENTTEDTAEKRTEDAAITEHTLEKRTEDTAENTTEDITENTSEKRTEDTAITEHTSEKRTEDTVEKKTNKKRRAKPIPKRPQRRPKKATKTD